MMLEDHTAGGTEPGDVEVSTGEKRKESQWKHSVQTLNFQFSVPLVLLC